MTKHRNGVTSAVVWAGSDIIAQVCPLDEEDYNDGQ